MRSARSPLADSESSVGILRQTAFMWKNVVQWLLGPAGILLGWWLNQHALRGNAQRQVKQAKDAAGVREYWNSFTDVRLSWTAPRRGHTDRLAVRRNEHV